MKRWMAAILCLCVLVTLAGCGNNQRRAVTCQEVVAAYEAAGYEVWHKDYPEKEDGYRCCIEVEGGEDHISFYFYETPAEAEAYAEERQWNIVLWLFSVIYSDPTWLETTTYQNIEIEYDDSDLYKPFRKLIQ